MELKIKAEKGDYSLRTYDKDGREIYYTSTRLVHPIGGQGGIKFEKDNLVCSVPDESVAYKLLSLVRPSDGQAGGKEDKIIKISSKHD